MPQTSELVERMAHRRAVEVVIWGMPAVNTDLMFQAMARAVVGDWNQIVYWSRLVDWKNQTLTPNPDAIYIMPFFNTAQTGPMVLDIPAAGEGSITGSIMDCWQTPLEDVGPAGVDKGRGGKYLVLPPGYSGPVPDGHIPLPSQTYQGYALLRSILTSGSDADFGKALDYGKRIRLYPLSARASPRARRRRPISTPPGCFSTRPSPTMRASSSHSRASWKANMVSCQLSPAYESSRAQGHRIALKRAVKNAFLSFG
jgi:hypothetical protein